jgi:hypothetical protein
MNPLSSADLYRHDGDKFLAQYGITTDKDMPADGDIPYGASGYADLNIRAGKMLYWKTLDKTYALGPTFRNFTVALTGTQQQDDFEQLVLLGNMITDAGCHRKCTAEIFAMICGYSEARIRYWEPNDTRQRLLKAVGIAVLPFTPQQKLTLMDGEFNMAEINDQVNAGLSSSLIIEMYA